MEIGMFPSRGGFSVRSIFTFVLAVVMTVLLWTFLSSTSAHAADADWNGAAISYGGNQYTSMGEVKAVDSSGLPLGTTYYMYVPTPQAQGSTQAHQKAYVIYFASGVSPPTATSATYVEYDYNASTKQLTNASGTKTISVDASTANTGATACAIDGIGYIVCPVMNFLSWGMDSVFNLLAGFMAVQPLETGNTQGSLYSAWNIMRGIANVAFIIVFMIIIYSQLTNVQVGNYGIKKLLPRLIIAAIAVNVSYIICAAAVDLSNILGYSLQDVFIGLRNQIMGTPSQTSASLASWQSVTGFILSGGTAAVVAGIGVGSALIATGGSVTTAVFLLLPALMGLLLAILVVLLILAARQALIVILVIIAPLAIVAYLLPNTEKWFEKWRDLFMTMLIFFPAFSVVFGGSQLAGAVIIQNASSINMLILGMIVQVAPLVLTPLILKFSGTVLGNIAKLVNNPNKGIIDRTRNWSNSHAAWHKNRALSGTNRDGSPGELGRRAYLRKSSRYLDQRKKVREERTANAGVGVQTSYENSRLYEKYDMAQQKATFEAKKEDTHSRHAAHVDAARRTQGSMIYSSAIDAQASKERAEASQNQTTAYYNRIRTKRSVAENLGGSALFESSYSVEVSKSRLETSENLKTEYYTSQRAMKRTELAGTTRDLEISKLKVEAAQNTYTAVVEDMKHENPRAPITIAAEKAQSSKELLESAQGRLQAYFDTERERVGSRLNESTLELENTKSLGERAKADLSTYIAKERSSQTGSLHLSSIDAERAKLAQQRAEATFTRVVEELKGGGKQDEDGNILINGSIATPAELLLMDQMKADNALMASERQGSTSAQYVQQAYISSLMDENSTDPLSAEALDIAAGIDPNGRTRAQANAISQLDKLEKEGLTNSVTLLNDRAEKQGKTLKGLAKEIFGKHTGTLRDANKKLLPREVQDPSIVEAALEALAQDGDISTLRKARMDSSIDQGMLTRLFARNATTMKIKGGFDLQADPALAGASRETMDASIAGTLGEVTANNIASVKFGFWQEVSEDIDRIVVNTQAHPDDTMRVNGESGLEKTYRNITEALVNNDVRATIGDRLKETIAIHERLGRIYGDPEHPMDYSKYLNPEA